MPTKLVLSLLLVLSLALAALARETAPSFQQCEKQYQTQGAGQQQIERLSFIFGRIFALRCTAEFVEKHNAAITAIATVLLTFVTGALVWAGYLQIRTTRVQLRAYVFIHSAKVAIQDDDTTAITAIVVIKNSGQTPARKLINVSGFAVSSYPIQTMPRLSISEAEFSETRITRMDLGPISTSVSTTPISTEQGRATRAAKTEFISLLSEHKLIAFVYGEIRYEDAFGRRQWTKYRLMTGGPLGFTEGQLIGCDEGNEAT